MACKISKKYSQKNYGLEISLVNFPSYTTKVKKNTLILEQDPINSFEICTGRYHGRICTKYNCSANTNTSNNCSCFIEVVCKEKEVYNSGMCSFHFKEYWYQIMKKEIDNCPAFDTNFKLEPGEKIDSVNVHCKEHIYSFSYIKMDIGESDNFYKKEEGKTHSLEFYSEIITKAFCAVKKRKKQIKFLSDNESLTIRYLEGILQIEKQTGTKLKIKKFNVPKEVVYTELRELFKTLNGYES